MDPSTIFVLSLVLLLTIYILLSWSRQHGNQSLPPGPTPIPVLGTPKYMDLRASTKNFPKLSQKYGSVFTIWKMSEPVIVLCGYETVKEALVNQAEQFSERPMIPVLDLINQGYGTAFDPTMLLSMAVGNIISSVLFGEHFDYQDKQLQELLLSTSRHAKSTFISPRSMLCNVVPVLLKFSIIRQKILKEKQLLQNFVMKYIKHHKETLKPESPRDFIDHYLLKIKEVEHEMDPDFCDTGLLTMVIALLGAGTETTVSTLKFSLVLMAHYPEVQAKVQQEIDKATNSLRSPEIMDKPQLPYANAVIHEIQRVLDLAPIALFHAVTEDIKFRGYTIPKGTAVIPFLSSVLSDPSQWETPEVFNPGHFLDEEGMFRTRLAFMPFSAGKRICAGENLARMKLFLLFSALLQKFTFTLLPGTERQDQKNLNLKKNEILASGQICAVPRSLSK